MERLPQQKALSWWGPHAQPQQPRHLPSTQWHGARTQATWVLPPRVHTQHKYQALRHRCHPKCGGGVGGGLETKCYQELDQLSHYQKGGPPASVQARSASFWVKAVLWRWFVQSKKTEVFYQREPRGWKGCHSKKPSVDEVHTPSHSSLDTSPALSDTEQERKPHECCPHGSIPNTNIKHSDTGVHLSPT